MASRLMADQRERRHAPRATQQLSLALSGEGQEWTAETRNISASGVYCAVPQFIPPMTKLALRFELLNNGRSVPVKCTGVVVRIEAVVSGPQHAGYHLAIFFTDLSARDRSAISRFVSQRLAATPSTD